MGEPGEHWNPSRHTAPLPTDAYGCIDFRSGSQTNKAQVGSDLLLTAFCKQKNYELSPDFIC